MFSLAERTPAPLILQMEAAERHHRLSFRVQFLLTWAVVLTAIGGFLALAVGVNVDFLQQWAPFILGGIPMTLFISVTSIALAVVLAIFGALLPFHLRLKARLPNGVLGLIYLGLYGAGRFFLSYFRTDPTVFAGLRQAQLASLLMVVIAMIAIPILFRRGRSTKPVEPEPAAAA